MAQRRKSAPAFAQATLDIKTERIEYGQWPKPDERVEIAGVPGVWSYFGHEDYGRSMVLLMLIPWGVEDREHAKRTLAPIEKVRRLL
jgi:hypothetical protein